MSPESVETSIGRVLQQAENSSFGQATPDKAAIPNSAIRSFWEADLLAGEMMDDAIGAAATAESGEEQANGALHFLVGIDDDPGLVLVSESDRQGETELTLLGLVQFASLEANAEEVKLCLRHGSLQS